MLRPLLRPLIRSILRPMIGDSAISRIFARFDPVQNGHGTMQSAVVIANDFRVSALCVLTASATTVSLLGQAASALNYLKVLSTGFASLSIDGSVVTSTVLATKDTQIRTYGVELSGNDFLFQENGVTIDTVTDAVAAAKTLTLDAVAQSNGADFFDGIYADPKITDLVTAANSESWKIDQAIGNTEQSSSGNNILTLVFVPEADRGLFTLDTSVTPSEWIGQQLASSSALDWVAARGNSVISGGSGSIISTASTTATYGLSTPLLGLGIGTYRANATITKADVISLMRLRIGKSVGLSVNVVDEQTSTMSISYDDEYTSIADPMHLGAIVTGHNAGDTVTISDYSVEQIIKVAS